MAARTTTEVTGAPGLVFRVLATSAMHAPEMSDAPDPRTFVLIHGIGMSHRYLSRLHDELARTADVFSVDLPGFGGLPKPGTDVDVADMAAALGDVLDELGLTDVVLVGHSMGAQWAVELAVQRPELASGVVMIGPVADSRHRSPGAQLLALAVDSIGEPPNVNGVVFTDYLRCGPIWYLRQTRHMVGYRLEDRVGDLRKPLLVLRGGNDPIAGIEWCRRLRDRARHGSLVLVPRNRHVVQHTAPKAVAAAIGVWLSRHRRVEVGQSA